MTAAFRRWRADRRPAVRRRAAQPSCGSSTPHASRASHAGWRTARARNAGRGKLTRTGSSRRVRSDSLAYAYALTQRAREPCAAAHLARPCVCRALGSSCQQLRRGGGRTGCSQQPHVPSHVTPESAPKRALCMARVSQARGGNVRLGRRTNAPEYQLRGVGRTVHRSASAATPRARTGLERAGDARRGQLRHSTATRHSEVRESRRRAHTRRGAARTRERGRRSRRPAGLASAALAKQGAVLSV
jgi:hypothetical protein